MNKLLVIALLAATGLAGCATQSGSVATTAQVKTDCAATHASPAQRWRAVPARSCTVRPDTH